MDLNTPLPYKNVPLVLFLLCFASLCLGTLFAVSDSFVDTRILPKWYAFCGGAALVTAAIALASPRERLIRNLHLLFLIVTTACLGQAIYGILQYTHILPAYGKLPVTGSFDNPAGFAASLCAGLPFTLALFRDRHPWIRRYSTGAVLFIIGAIFLSYSRAGIVSVAVIALLWIFGRLKGRHRVTVGRMMLSLVPVLFVGLYLVKKDSADGRLLIWRCSLEMIADKPVFGHGPGGFTAQYMNYQADYFRAHPGSPYAQLADTIHHPFNEYLLVVIDYGLFGLALLASLGYIVLRQYRKRSIADPAVQAAGWCLISISVFALFSYPFFYPFVWVMVLLSLWIIFGAKVPTRPAVRLFLLLPALVIGVISYRDIHYQNQWRKVSREAAARRTESTLPQYEYLHHELVRDRYFLYNYAYELSVAGEYDKSLVVARECSQIWADYDLQLVLADTHMKMKQYVQAEQHFKQAAAMCPARFMPLYKLATIYVATGRTGQARALARQILEKEAKVPSPTVTAIQRDMRQLIDSLTFKTLNNEIKDSL